MAEIDSTNVATVALISKIAFSGEGNAGKGRWKTGMIELPF